MTDSQHQPVTAYTQCPQCAGIVPAQERCQHCGGGAHGQEKLHYQNDGNI